MSSAARPPHRRTTAQPLRDPRVRAVRSTGWYDPDGAAWEPESADERSIREPALRPAIRIEPRSEPPRP